MERPAPRAPWAAVCLGLLAGCSQALTAHGTMVEPAAVPVRAYPEIWVAGGFLEEDEIVLEQLMASLREGGRHRVRRVDPDELEPLRRAGRIPATAVVLVVDVRIQEDVRQAWDTQPVRFCGPYGCQTRYEQVPTNVPWVRGTAQLRVHDGPSARTLQRHVVRTDHYGGDPAQLRQVVARRLAERVSQAVRVLEQPVEVELYEVDDPEVQAALGAIREGDWQVGRARLERAVQSAAVQQLPVEQRARVYYDLGLARRFAPRDGPSEQAFEAAARAFERAQRLDPKPAYEEALQALENHREAFARLQEQRAATEHNFALFEDGERLPPPPPSYRTPAPAEAVPAAEPEPAEQDPAEEDPAEGDAVPRVEAPPEPGSP